MTSWRVPLAVLFALALPAAVRAGPSPVLVPPQKIPLRFSHVQHLTKAGLTCVFCHKNVSKSTRTEDRDIPGHAECDECHDRTAKEPAKASPPAACETCHEGYSSVRKDVAFTADLPAAYIKFPHKNHAERKIRCETCHGDYVRSRVGLATREQIPTMTKCLSCHDNRQAVFACPTCHLTRRGWLVQTSYPTGVLKPAGIFRNDRHDGNWLAGHRATAANDRAYCASCHTEQDCQDCHNGPMKPFKVHPGDFVSMHPLFAKSNALSCESCHRDQSFCLGCHQRTGVSHVTAFDRRGLVGSPRMGVAQRFHPDGWVRPVGGRSMNQHGFHAQRNIRQCSACHAERTCTESCHRSGLLSNGRGMGQGISPHGDARAWEARCSVLYARNRRVCYKCHLTGDPVLLRCR